MRRAQGVFHLAQVTDHGDVKPACSRRVRALERGGRLIDDANLASKSAGHALARELLERDQPIGACKRAQRRFGIALDVLVDIGPAQGNDQRPIRVELAKAPDALCAAPSMQRNHQIRPLAIVFGCHIDLMTKLAQNARPAGAGGGIAGT